MEISDSELRNLWQSDNLILLKSDSSRISYRSIADLNRVIIANLPWLANKFDCVVGIPRSGLLPASIIALHLNLPVYTINEFALHCENTTWSARKYASRHTGTADVFKVLVVDDSINTGSALSRVRETITSIKRHFYPTYLAIYATSAGAELVDLYFEKLDHPRAFEWNVMHHGYTADFLVDLDGILCKDGPPENSNDNGAYLTYITDALPKLLITTTIGAIVTSRLEKYRDVTRAWLARYGIKYKQLIMLNLETPEMRRELRVHGRYKADVYKALGGRLFIESEEWQAITIAKLSGKAVLWLDQSKIF